MTDWKEGSKGTELGKGRCGVIFKKNYLSLIKFMIIFIVFSSIDSKESSEEDMIFITELKISGFSLFFNSSK